MHCENGVLDFESCLLHNELFGFSSVPWPSCRHRPPAQHHPASSFLKGKSSMTDDEGRSHYCIDVTISKDVDEIGDVPSIGRLYKIDHPEGWMLIRSSDTSVSTCL